ncbi:hypothetical protein FHW58_000983 [Duganella sp. 1224]|uniref:hypothetical protein n=1 Tax=Duganella sp. 1224 TaxID=2587052 RepID=UPI0015CD766B|nr:hypothetical protein [Duganella sp. 1224]NYE59831.1 hypothetical protein [Duganella sp. 1224]
MKASIRAALISALLFPGLGHLALRPRRASRGMLFLVPTALAVLYLLGSMLQLVSQLQQELNEGRLALDPFAILDRVHASGIDNPATNLAAAVMLVGWIGALIDVVWLGKRMTS